MKLKLIENWREAYRYISVQLTTLLVVLSGLEAYMPQVQAYLPENWSMFLGGAILLARIVQQAKMSVKEANDVLADKAGD